MHSLFDIAAQYATHYSINILIKDAAYLKVYAWTIVES